MIGHMILRRGASRESSAGSGAAILGLKVVGGKMLESGLRGAVIEKVKKGSIADVEGQLRPGERHSRTIQNGFRESILGREISSRSLSCFR